MRIAKALYFLLFCVIITISLSIASTPAVIHAEDVSPPPQQDVPVVQEPYQSPLVEHVSQIIYTEGNKISEEDAYKAANQIIFMMNEHDMNLEEDLPYILSLFYFESKFDPLAENPYSTASGFGQLLGMHAWKFPGCEGHKNWNNCDAWKNVEQNIFESFNIMAYKKYAHQEPHRRWRNIYRFNYHTARFGGTKYHDKFEELLIPAFSMLVL